MSRTARFTGGVGIGYLNQAVVTVVGLWLTPYLLHRLGQGDYGLWLIALQMVAYLGLLDLGVVALLPREVGFAVGRSGERENVPDLPIILGRTVRVVLWQLPLILAGGAVAWWCLPNEWHALRGPVAGILLVLVLSFPFRVFQAVLQGLQDLAFIGLATLGAWLVGTLVTVGLLLGTELGLYAVSLGWAATQFANTLACWMRLRTRFPWALPTALPRLSWREARVALSAGSWVSLSQVATILLQATDLLVIASVLGQAAVVPYSLTKKLVDVLANQPQLIMQSAMPALSELRSGSSLSRLRQVTSSLTLATLLVSGAVCLLVLVVNRGFVDWWVGPSQFGGSSLTTLLVFLMLFRHWNTTAVYAIFCFGHQRRISLTSLADGVVTVVSGVLLAKVFGVLGVVFGSFCGLLLVSLPNNLRTLARETDTSVLALGRELFPWFWRFMLLALGAVLVVTRWAPSSFAGLVAASIVTVSIYVCVMLPVLWGPVIGPYVRTRFASLPRFRTTNATQEGRP